MPRTTPAPTQPSGRKWLDYESGSVYLGVSVRVLQRLVQKRQVSHTKIGKSVLFSAEQLDAYIEACTVETER